LSTGHVRADESGKGGPLLATGKPVDWWFVFKFNSSAFPACGENTERSCIFGGKVQTRYETNFSQQYVFASSADGDLKKGTGCAGATTLDPIGATFDQVYNDRSLYYVIWNDQFYQDPALCGKSDSCGKPWAHAKGMLAWNEAGEGFVLQVSTPSWPGSGSREHPRKHGNTLGCVTTNNVRFSQHFFAVKLKNDDVSVVLKALKNAGILTNIDNDQLVRNGGPEEIQALVRDIKSKTSGNAYTNDTLTSNVTVISKPAALWVPPWQMVSAVLGGQALRSASWWNNHKIYSTTASTRITCWSDSLRQPGPVEIATSGGWNGTSFGLKGGSNHAKIAISTAKNSDYVIFGDMNQEGSLIKNQGCDIAQNSRGGLFYVVRDRKLHRTMSELLGGDKAPTRAPR
jgi:hypothetical protein